MVLSKKEIWGKCNSVCTFCLLPESDSNCIKGFMQKFAKILSVYSLCLGFHFKIFRNLSRYCFDYDNLLTLSFLLLFFPPLLSTG